MDPNKKDNYIWDESERITVDVHEMATFGTIFRFLTDDGQIVLSANEIKSLCKGEMKLVRK